MRISLPTLTAIPLALFLASCGQEAGEDSGVSKPFDRIADTASITLAGVEPFWSIDIDPDEDGFIARYSTPENIRGSQFSVSRFAGNQGLGFNGHLDGVLVQVTITPGECTDGMSDRSYPYTGTVAIGDKTLYGCSFTSDDPFRDEGKP